MAVNEERSPEERSEELQYTTIKAANGAEFRLDRHLADTRECLDGIPGERRTLYFCRRVRPDDEQESSEDEYVVKVKHQSALSESKSQDSEATKKELQALRLFKEKGFLQSPHLVDFVESTSSASNVLSRTTYLIMTKMPGRNLLELKYWSLGVQERSEIQQEFLKALHILSKIGIAPSDRALRNIMWEAKSKRLSIVDFEMWETPSAFAMNEERELQLWGLASRPPPATWHEEWKLHH